MSTKTTYRARDSRGFSHNHGSRLSLDPDHHVTEAIGDMYGEWTDEDGNRYSYIAQAAPETLSKKPNRLSTASALSAPGMQGRGGGYSNSQTSPGSPTVSIRSASPSLGDAANKQYSLNDIDYESDPVAVAQEISNLQALRRMSMDVTSSADPDLPSFNSFVPSTPPDDNGDPGSVFWVPARLHPELAPQEFSAYLEAKKNEIRRPTRDGSLSPDGPNSLSSSSGGGGGGLRRKKSMLSRQINNHEAARGYRDGAERLEKRKSLQGRPQVQLDDLMKDPSTLMQKLNVDAQRRSEEDPEDDAPIITAPTMGLRRSTATHYRKGSLRRGERIGSNKRLALKAAGAAETDFEDSSPVVSKGGFKLERVQTEPISLSSRRGTTPSSAIAPSTSFDERAPKTAASYSSSNDSLNEKIEKHKSAPAKARRSSSPKAGARSRTSEPTPPVPKIVETPPIEHSDKDSLQERPGSSSPKKRPPLNRVSDSITDLKAAAQENREHMSVPGDKKDKKKAESTGSSKDRKTSWGWLPGYSAEKEKEKEERREREKEEKAKAKKEKRPKSSEKHDNTRLDVLQKSIEMGNSGKVVAVDPAAKLDEKEARKSKSEDKKDSIFSFFGGSRKKSGDHGSNKKGSSSRGTSPDPPREKEQPPFYYSRFPIHIERAIYRLSHLKLANPRRPLQQQVLLSNFMYSYLAKVQQTQPHLIQQATSQPKQSKSCDDRQHQQQQQQQQQRQQQQQERGRQRESESQQQKQKQKQQNHQDRQGYHDADSRDQTTDYVDDSRMYEYDDDSDRPKSRQAQYNNQNNSNPNGYYDQQEKDRSRQAVEYSNGSNSGNGTAHDDYYSQKSSRSSEKSERDREREREEMW